VANTPWSAICARRFQFAEIMNLSRRIALIAFIVALLIVLAVGFYRAVMHEEARPDTAPAASTSTNPSH
jgi:hypothetical protein